MIIGIGDFRYERVEGWAKFPEGFYFEQKIYTALDVAVDSKDRLFVFNSGNHPVIILSRDGNFVSCWGEGHFINPHCIHIGPDDAVYLVDAQAHVVEKYSPDGKLLMTLTSVMDPRRGWAEPVHHNKPFNLPTGVALGPAGEIYVSDGYGNRCVHKFSPKGELIKTWGGPGSAAGQFSLPHAIGVDKHGNVYVVDREPNHRIQVFTSDGEFITMWTGFNYPKDVYIDQKNDLIYIGEGYSHPDCAPKISIRDLRGNVLAEWGGRESQGKGVLENVVGIWLDAHGDMYVAENEPGPRVEKYAKVS